NMSPTPEHNIPLTRRHFFGRTATGIGTAALAALFNPRLLAADAATGGFSRGSTRRGVLEQPHFAPRAKRVIYIVMSGGPSQIDLFDYKPKLTELNGTELPGSVRMGQRITGMTAGQKTFPCAAA